MSGHMRDCRPRLRGLYCTWRTELRLTEAFDPAAKAVRVQSSAAGSGGQAGETMEAAGRVRPSFTPLVPEPRWLARGGLVECKV